MVELEVHDEVVEWFDSLSQDEWERVSIIVDRLVGLGSQARMPLSRSLGDELFESAVAQDRYLGQLIHDLRTEAGLSQRELAERMGTTQSVISRLEEGGGARNRIDTLARVAEALDRHLVLSFPAEVPDKLTDAVQVV